MEISIVELNLAFDEWINSIPMILTEEEVDVYYEAYFQAFKEL